MTAGAKSRARPGPLEWADQKLNAILVKDVRAWLRSKKFLIVFFVAMVLIQVITFVMTVIPRVDSGSTLFAILTSGLAFFLVGVLPFLMHDRFTDELSSGSTELALISRMTPGMLVRGKIMSGLAASLLFFAAAGPSLTIAYMLGGVDLIMLFYTIGLLLFSSVISMIMAILIVSITGKRRLKFLGLLPIAAGVAMVGVVVAMTEIVQKEDSLLDVEFWLLNIVFAGYIALFALFFYTVAVSRLLLDNFDHVKAYWVSLGLGVAQTALAYGADDLDGTVRQEKIHHEAGSTTPEGLSVDELRRLIEETGHEPVERNTLYRRVKREGNQWEVEEAI